MIYLGAYHAGSCVCVSAHQRISTTTLALKKQVGRMSYLLDVIQLISAFSASGA